MLSNIILGWKGAAITGVAALVIGLSGGWKAHSIKTKADKADALEAARVAHIEAMADLKADLDAAELERRALAQKLEIAQSNVRTVTKEVIREIPKYIKDSSDSCDRTLSPEFARLYNRSIGITAGRADSEEDAARYSAPALRLAGGDED